MRTAPVIMGGARELRLKRPGVVAAHLAVVLSLTLAAGASLPVAAATVTIDAERDGDTINIHASALLNADAATAWRVLTDYERYPEFIPDLRLSRVVARQADTVTVEQSGDAALWFLRSSLHITFEIREIPPHRLLSRAVAGNLRALTSSYALTPAATGMRLDYVGHIAPGFALLGPIEKTAVETNIARQFHALADEIETRSAAARSDSVADVK